MKVEQVDINKLRPFPGNPKRHPEKQIEKLVRSLKEFGWTNPILATKDNMIVAGHARIEAAKKAGIKKVPVIYLPFDGKKALAYNLADNRLAELAEWDFTKMADLLVELDDGEFDLELTGFDMKEIEEIMSWTPEEVKEEEPFDVEEEVEKIKEPKTKRGDIYELGRHRLMCGDCTFIDDVKQLLRGVNVQAVLTDPPYQNQKAIANDNLPNEDYEQLHRDFLSLLSSNIFVSFHSPRTFPVLLDTARSAGWKFERMLWFYEVGGGTQAFPWRGWWMQGECILIFTRGKPNWPKRVNYTSDTYKHQFGDNRVTEFGSIKGENPLNHPTVKPLWIVRDLVEKISKRGDIIEDPFGGSGTTLIASEQTGRICYMMEIDPVYCDVIVNRWEKYTGKEAVKLK